MSHNKGISFKDCKDIVTGVIGLIFAAVFYTQSKKIRIFAMSGAVNAQFMPRLLSIIITIFSVLLIISNCLKLRQKSAQNQETGSVTEKEEWGPQLLILVLLILYIALFKPLGFVVSSALFMFAALSLLILKENKNYFILTAVSVIVPVLTYVIFRYGLDVLLPVGILGFLGV